MIQLQKHYFDIVTSTQGPAKTLAATLSPNNWHAIIANQQTAGIGAHQSHWQSDADNVYLTLAFTINKKHTALLRFMPQVSALSVCELLEQQWRLPANIRWVNDVLVEQKKIAGILSESEVHPCNNEWRNVFIGIGCNVNMNANELAAISQAATSVLLQTGETYQTKKIADALITLLQKNIYILLSDGFNALLPAINQRLAFKQQPISVLTTNDGKEKSIKGKLLELGLDGGLKILTTDGDIININQGRQLRLDSHDSHQS